MSRNYSVVSVVSNLTRGEASKINSAIINAKEKYAPDSRGTSVTGKSQNVGNMLGSGQKNVLGSGNHAKTSKQSY